MKERSVHWGTPAKGDEHSLFLIELDHSTNKSHIYIFENPDKAFIEQVMGKWKKGGQVPFPNHSHIVHDVALSPIHPVYARVRNPEIATRRAKKRHHEKLSQKCGAIVESEIKRLKYSISSNSDNKKAWEIAKILSQRMLDLKKAYKEGKNTTDVLTHEEYGRLRKKLDEVFELLKKRQDEQKKALEKESSAKLARLKSQLQRAAKQIHVSNPIWKSIYADLKSIGDEFRKSRLETGHYQEFKKLLDKTYAELKQKQDKAYKERKALQESNFKRLHKVLNQVLSSVKHTEKISDIYPVINSAREALKSADLQKNHRDQLWKELKSHQTQLQNRKDREQKQYQKICSDNFNRFKSSLSQVSRSVHTSTDLKATRAKLNDVKSQIKGSKLNKEQRNQIWAEWKSISDAIWKRQSRERERYEEQCHDNYRKAERLKNEVWRIAEYESDFRQGKVRLQGYMKELFGLRPMKKEQKNTVITKAKEAQDHFYKRQQAFYAQRQEQREAKAREWKSRMRENISKKQSYIYELKDRLRDKQNKLYNVRPGPKEYEIRNSLNASISRIEDKIRSEEQKIRDMENKLN